MVKPMWSLLSLFCPLHIVDERIYELYNDTVKIDWERNDEKGNCFTNGLTIQVFYEVLREYDDNILSNAGFKAQRWSLSKTHRLLYGRGSAGPG